MSSRKRGPSTSEGVEDVKRTKGKEKELKANEGTFTGTD